MPRYIHQLKDWPEFELDYGSIINSLTEVRNLQGKLMGKMEALGFERRNEATLQSLTREILKSSEIEGELLDRQQVRSSIARKLGLQLKDSIPTSRETDAVVAVLMNATQQFNDPLDTQRLFAWHSAVFPTGRSGAYKIQVGQWREDTTGTMQVVSGAMGKEKVHFQAPESDAVATEMERFMIWFNNDESHDPVLKAAIAHVWFLTIHPFDNGNGRIARVLTEMLLARSDNSSQRFYSLSAQIRKQRKGYYKILEETQKGDLDITRFVLWFLDCLNSAIEAADKIVAGSLDKSRFWREKSNVALNNRQTKILNRLLDGFKGKLTSSKYAKITKCSRDTAIRDINDLIKKEMLVKENAGGRSTSYSLLLT